MENNKLPAIKVEDVAYKVTRYSPGEYIPDSVFFKTKDKALKLARAMATEGALSSEPGDIIVVEQVTTEEVARFERTK